MKFRKNLLFAFLLTAALLLQCLVPTAAFAEEAEPETPQTAEVNLTVPSGEEDLLTLLVQVKDYISRVYPGSVDSATLYQGMLRGLFQSLGDPYSQYYNKEEFEDLLMTLDNAYSGVGVVIELVDNRVQVMSIVKGSPAEQAGVMPGDIILTVGEKECKTTIDAATELRGDPGTSVVVTISRPSTGELLTFSLSRAYITPSTIDSKDLGQGIHYIKISQFTSLSAVEFPEELERAKANGAQGLILDLRDNPGGLLDAGTEVAKRLVPKGTIVELVGKDVSQTITNQLETQPIPVVVLVNGGTASASEIVAGAIRDYDAGRLVGQKTFGKGVIQRVLQIPEDLGGIKITIAEYHTPKGTAINGAGITPDYEVEPAGNTVPAKIEFKREMRGGIVGLDVLALQESLKFLGYGVGNVDGVFGPLTAAAISAFCRDHSVGYRGIVELRHVDAVNSAVAERVSKMPDTVLERGISILRNRLQSGVWE